MKKCLSTLLILCILLSVITLNSNMAYSKTRKELNYSSKEVAKVIKIKKTYDLLGNFEGLCDARFLKLSYKKTINRYNSYTKWEMTYQLVKNKKINTMKKLKKYLGKYLSPKLIKKYLKRKYFIEQNGKLYYGSGDRGGNIMYLNTKYKIVKQSNSRRKIRAVSRYWKNYESYPKKISKKIEYYKQKKIKGRWVFYKVSLPY